MLGCHFFCLCLSQVPTFYRGWTACEWDDGTGEVVGYKLYGYDGEDFIVLDLQTLTWTAPKQQAFITKLQWDTDKARLEFIKNFYFNICPDRLKKYVHYGRIFLQRTGRITRPDVPLYMDSVFLRHWIIPMKIISWHILVSQYRLILCLSLSTERPSVSLLQKTPSSPVSCLRYRFLPRQSHDVLEERWRGDSWGRGPRRDPPQPRWILPDECWAEPVISRTWKTGGGTTVCFISLVWWTTSSPDWTKQWSGPTGVRLVYTCIFVYLFATDSCNIWWTVRT